MARRGDAGRAYQEQGKAERLDFHRSNALALILCRSATGRPIGMETVLVETCKSGRTTRDDRQVGRHLARFLMGNREEARYRRIVRV